MRIGVDLDEVLTPCIEAFLPRYNRLHGTDTQATQLRSYRLDEEIGHPIEKVAAEVRRFYVEDAPGLQPYPEAQRALRELKRRGHELFVITARHNEGREITPPWIEQHFPGIFDGIFFSDIHFDEKQNSKGDICKAHGITLLIEDDPYHAARCESLGVACILLERPWNREARGKFLFVKDWKEIVERIGAMEQKRS